MTLRQTSCMVLVALIGFGCGGYRSRTMKLAREIGINELRLDLTLLVSAEGAQQEIPEASWSEYVRRFRPLAVQRHMGGVLIVVSRVGRQQEGLLVMLDSKGDP